MELHVANEILPLYYRKKKRRLSSPSAKSESKLGLNATSVAKIYVLLLYTDFREHKKI